MPRKLGSCPSCRGAIYDVEGLSDACGCDDGVLTTLTLRSGGTPVRARVANGRANRNGDVLPELDFTMFLSRSAQAEIAGAQHLGISMGTRVPIEAADEDYFVPAQGGLDISFEQPEEAWPAGLARPTTPTRDRFRVDRGAPARAPFQGRMASGPSDGEVVGRVGAPLGRPQPVYEVGRERPVEWVPGRPVVSAREEAAEWASLERAHNTHIASLRQEARVVQPRPAGTRPLESRPVDRTKIPTALERLGRVDFDDDPFK